MNLQQAMMAALDFEKKVRDHYLGSAGDILDPRGRRVFATLAKEEQRHVDYLERCLAQWKQAGRVPDVPLRSILPDGVTWIEEARKKLSAPEGERVASETELGALAAALRFEKEADAFYRELVSTLSKEERALFDRFLRTEAGHLALVQAQLDAVQGRGFWFDISQFIQDG